LLVTLSVSAAKEEEGRKQDDSRMFRALQLILRKKKGGVLGPAALSGFVNGFSSAPNSQRYVGFGSILVCGQQEEPLTLGVECGSIQLL
jgi:hypothetical protein